MFDGGESSRKTTDRCALIFFGPLPALATLSSGPKTLVLAGCPAGLTERRWMDGTRRKDMGRRGHAAATADTAAAIPSFRLEGVLGKSVWRKGSKERTRRRA